MTAPADWLDHLADEADAAYLYRELAALEQEAKRAAVYSGLADIEDRHVAAWQVLLRAEGHDVEVPSPSLQAKLRAWVARRIGAKLLLPMLLQEEGREVKGYLAMYREAPEGAAGPTALRLARESSEHAERLAGLTGSSPEPWHKTGAGGFLRNVVYGFNDGLTANFGLVAGMIGAAAATPGSNVVLVAGLAGMAANALSMASSGYLAAKSEREVHEHELAMERDEIRLMPDLEREELSLIYQAKGMTKVQSDEIADRVMTDPDLALAEMSREELGISEPTTTPLREAWVTGLATALGSLIPVFPFFFGTGIWVIWTAFTLAMLSHFAVGAARSFFTGRGVLRSGLDMFVVGLGVAGIGFLIGDLIVGLF